LIFVIRADFLIDIATGDKDSSALYHRAHKKITHCDPNTFEEIVPTKENGWKFELFLHNFMPMVQLGKLGVLQVNRDTEFAPVKNANGQGPQPLPDTPDYARMMILNEATQWLLKPYDEDY